MGDASCDMFLPCLQFMECTTPFSWDHILQLYQLGHRHSLTLKFPTNISQTNKETAVELLNFVEEGAKFQIFDDSVGGDFLENFRKRKVVSLSLGDLSKLKCYFRIPNIS